MVETIPDPVVGFMPGGPMMGSLHHRKDRQNRGTVRRSQPKTVEDLLQRLGLEVGTAMIFVIFPPKAEEYRFLHIHPLHLSRAITK